ncbi:cytochrome P450 [Nocardia concava]|uniref:cytochrome P450 n=1 Tax=Nocardia concava TaxID=257281 RepID=UPI001FE05307|nr:cytochrome P450 [Nocardia concava]
MLKLPEDFELPALRPQQPAPPRPGSGLKSIPGDAGLPVVADTFRYFPDPGAWCVRQYHRYGPVSWFGLIGLTGVAALGPDAWDVVARNKDRAFAAGPGWGKMIGPFFTRGLLLLDFDEHLFHKRVMQEAFGRPRLISYLDEMNPAITAALAKWQPGQRFPASRQLKQLTLDVATRVFMGEEPGPESDELNAAFTDCVYAGSAPIRFRMPGARYRLPGTRWARGLDGRKVLERHFYERLADKRASTGNDLFTVLCHARTGNGEEFTDVDVVNHMIFLMLAAHDTATITMTTMLYQLAKHPQWQQRCREESLALGKPALEFTDLDRLPALDMVMKEALRLVAPIPHMLRYTVKDTEILGHFVPQGTYVLVNPQMSHQLPEIWPDPARFDPERFAEDRREDKAHKNAWVPFGSGAHKCIGMYFAGMEIKATLHQMLQRFEWSVEPGYEIPWDRWTLPIAKDGMPVDLRPLR